MEKQKNKIIYFLTQSVIVFSVFMIFITIVGILAGDEAQDISSMYQFGNQGLAFSTILQFMLLAVLIAAVNLFFSSEKLFKNMLTLWRVSLVMATIFLLVIVFIITFGWFNLDNLSAWLSFLICFGGCAGASIGVMVIKNRKETKKYDILLKEYKTNFMKRES